MAVPATKLRTTAVDSPATAGFRVHHRQARSNRPTGRAMIGKCEGAYHGSYDYAEVSQGVAPADWGELDAPNSVPPSRGTPPSVGSVE